MDWQDVMLGCLLVWGLGLGIVFTVLGVGYVVEWRWDRRHR